MKNGHNPEIEKQIIDGEIVDLKNLFLKTNTNYTNLNEHLGIRPKKFTHLMSKPETTGCLTIAKEISRVTNVRATIIIEKLRVGVDKISFAEWENLKKEEEFNHKEKAA